MTVIKIFKHAARVIIIPPLLYLGAAVLLGIFPINHQYHQTSDGIDIFIRANAVHADLLLPMKTGQRDWNARLRDLDAREYLSIGWGDRAFFLETKNWSDLRLDNATLALTGMDSAVLHIASEDRPQISMDTVRIRISCAQYALMIADIDSAFKLDAFGRPIVIAGAHYADNDHFYEASGRYSMFTTCNEWVRGVLATAGIRTSAWAPFSSALMFQARHLAGPSD